MKSFQQEVGIARQAVEGQALPRFGAVVSSHGPRSFLYHLPPRVAFLGNPFCMSSNIGFLEESLKSGGKERFLREFPYSSDGH